MVILKIRPFLISSLIALLCLGFMSCGVKKAPDPYYKHPLNFDGKPEPLVTPSITPIQNPGPSP